MFYRTFSFLTNNYFIFSIYNPIYLASALHSCYVGARQRKRANGVSETRHVSLTQTGTDVARTPVLDCVSDSGGLPPRRKQALLLYCACLMRRLGCLIGCPATRHISSHRLVREQGRFSRQRHGWQFRYKFSHRGVANSRRAVEGSTVRYTKIHT